MTLVLLAVGLIFAAVGLVAIGFGIPINAFSLGNTLILSGTIGLVGGMILMGVALVMGQLKRIAEALRGRPMAARMAESVEALAPTPVARPTPPAAPTPVVLPEPAMVAEPPRSPEPRAPEPWAPEPRFPATVSDPAPGPLDWLRVKSKPVDVPTSSAPMPTPPAPPIVAEPPMVDVIDEAPLSPRSAPEPALEPKVWSPSREPGPLETRLAPRAEPPMQRAAPQVEPPKEKERFDLVWPDRGATTAPTEPKPEAKPALDMPLPPVPARPRETRPAAEKRMPDLPRKALERGPAILKSGVIDGMPYTLYADGSIEAQLPQGMVKFASVDALRAHLEKQG
ncbi:MAG: hypothetical protein WCG92_14575 [Hyphomicrobiales bacterium]